MSTSALSQNTSRLILLRAAVVFAHDVVNRIVLLTHIGLLI